MSDLRTALREARRAKGWSLRRAEEETGISNGYLSLLETGKAKSPSPAVLDALASKYELPFDQLMEMAGHPSGPVRVTPAITFYPYHDKPFFLNGAREGESRDASDRWQTVDWVRTLPSVPLDEPSRRSSAQWQSEGMSVAFEGDPTTGGEDKERTEVVQLLLEDIHDLSVDQIGHVRAYVAGLKTTRPSR